MGVLHWGTLRPRRLNCSLRVQQENLSQPHNLVRAQENLESNLRDGTGFCDRGREPGQEQPGTGWQGCNLMTIENSLLGLHLKALLLQSLERSR